MENMINKSLAIRAIILCSSIFSLPVSAAEAAPGSYQRTVHYHDQVVVQCEFVESSYYRALLWDLLEFDSVDPWGVDEGGRVHVRLSAQLWSNVQRSLPECSVVIANVENYVTEAEKQMTSKAESEVFEDAKGQDEVGWFKEYHHYEEIVEWYRNLTSDYSKISRFVESIGLSFEGRNIPAVHFTASKSPEFTIYFQCQIHAREWISGAVCMYIANHLCEKYSQKEKEVTKLLDKLEFVFVPIVNPDGYKYTWSKDRLWRKNRKTFPESTCVGVDLNRNYNDHWGGEGSSGSPCSDVYHGEGPVSEPETSATQEYFKKQKRVIGAIDWHSYSQLIMRPNGWTRSESPDENKLKEIGDEMSVAIKKVHGVEYISQRAASLYVASGTASDWFYSAEATDANEGYRAASYTIELRDTGTHKFILPPDQIIPTGQEVVPAVISFAKSILAKPLRNE